MSKALRAFCLVPCLHLTVIALACLCLAGRADETALVLSGAKPNVALPDEAAFDFETAMTVEAWVWLDSGITAPKWEAIVTKGDTAWGLTRYSDTNKISFRTHNGLQIHDLVGPIELATNTWYHVAATFDGSAKALYLDGEEIANVPWAGPIALNEFNVILGANEEKSGRSLTGRLDTVRIWNVGRTEAQVQAAMRRRLYGNETGLVGCWRLDEDAASTDALDSSLHVGAANPRNGAVTTDAIPKRVAGVAVGAPLSGNRMLTFNGTDEQIVTPVSLESRFDFASTMTVEFWLYVESVTDAFGLRVPLVSKGSGGWELGIKPSRKLEFNAGATPLQSTTVLDLATWYHVAAVFDNGAKHIYINGELDNTAAGAGNMATNDLPVRIGHSGWVVSPYFHGRADNVRIWGTARTARQISDNTARLINGNEPDLVGAWQFDAFNGSYAADSRTVIRDAADVVLDFTAQGRADAGVNIFASPLTTGAGLGACRLDDDGGQGQLAVLGALHPSYSGSAAVFNRSSLAATSLQLISGQPFNLRSVTIADAPETSTTTDAEVAGADVQVEVASAAPFAVGDTVSVRDGVNDETSIAIEAIAGNTLTLDLATAKQAGAVVAMVQPSVEITFVGTKDDAAETVIEQTFTVTGGTTNPQTLEFVGFDDIVEVSWRRTSLPNNARLLHQVDNITMRVAASTAAGTPADGHMQNMDNLNRFAAERTYDEALRPQYAISLDGAADHLLAPHNDVLNLDDLTIEAWIRPTNTGTRQTILRKGEGGYALTIAGDNKLEYWVDDQAANVLTSSTPITPDVWQHVAVRVNKFTDKTTFFINGVPAGTHAFSLVVNNAEQLVMGRKGPNTAAEHFQGGLDEVRVWSYARTDAEIAFLSARQPVTAMTGLVARWAMNDGVSLTAAESATGLDAQLVNMTGTEWLYGPDTFTADGHYAMTFAAASANDYVQAPNGALALASMTALTIEAWIRPEELTHDSDLKDIVRKGNDGFGLALDNGNYLRYTVSATNSDAVKSYLAVRNDEWHHVAVRVDTATDTTEFFRNGVSIGTVDGATIATNNDPFVIGRQYKGTIDEVRVWSVARSDDEILAYAFRPLQDLPWGLIGYWRFDDGQGTAVADSGPNTHDGVFNGVGGTWSAGHHRLDDENAFWDMVEFRNDENYSRNATNPGLWVGTVSLNAVSEIRGDDPTETTATAQTMDFRILLHVDTHGSARLLKKVTAMQQDLTDADARVVLLTDDSYIPYFSGIVRREGKMIGKRFTAVAYDFPGHELEMLGGVGPGLSCSGKIMMPRRHPTNPYRHKRHPDHTRGYDIFREITVWFNQTGDHPGYGTDTLTGSYREKVTGLHRLPIYTEGSIELLKISDVEVLNE